MGILSLPTEALIFSIAILLITVIGCITALVSWTRISSETKGVKYAEANLISDAAWEGAYPQDKIKLAGWLRDKGIKPDSHLGDFIRTCWSAWLGGRPASLTELHVLVARRERSYASTRLSFGISALLLVFGIVGTLASIKPVLSEFRFQIADESNNRSAAGEVEVVGANKQSEEELESVKDATSVAANTDLVNTLIHNLGNAFWPSLLALVGTIGVVSCRGLYSLSLFKFALELDRFAVDMLIPRYRVPSLSEQYQEVKVTLAHVTDSLLQREGRFHEAVEQLERLVTAISPALGGLEAAAVASKNAAENLSSRARSISDGLTRNLGSKSPIYRAITGFEGIFHKTERSLSNFSCLVDGIGQANTDNQNNLETAIQGLIHSVDKIGEDHRNYQFEATGVLRNFSDSMANIPEVLQIVSEKTAEKGIITIKSGIAQLQDEQKKWHIASTEELKAITGVGLVGVVKAGKELMTESKKVATAVLDISSIREDAKVALKELTDAGKKEIIQAGYIVKSEMDANSGKLATEVNNISAVAERLSNLQFTTAKNRENQRDDIAGRKEESENSFKDLPEVIQHATLVPTSVENPKTADLLPDAVHAPLSASKEFTCNTFPGKSVSEEVTPESQDLAQQVTEDKSLNDGSDFKDDLTNLNSKAPENKWLFSANSFFRRRS